MASTQAYHDNICSLEVELYHMSISSSTDDVLKSLSSHPSPIFLDQLEESHGQEPPPLCQCGLEECTCSLHSQLDYETCEPPGLHTYIPEDVSGPRHCSCKCHHQENTGGEHLTAVQKVIILAVQELQSNTPYGAIASEVHQRVHEKIETTLAEYESALHWLVEESYVMSPLDDGRLIVVPQYNMSDI
ncbi:hypothetical protein BD769DRAFT_1669242 [Suillus cothurnatus]|nr:hypothetical protein BD769DRAFT_1669242 [Suillus cothurnatus]